MENKKSAAPKNPELVAKAKKKMNATIAELRALPKDHIKSVKNKHIMEPGWAWSDYYAYGTIGIAADGPSFAMQASLTIIGTPPNVIIEAVNSGMGAGVGVGDIAGWFTVSTSGIIGPCQVTVIGETEVVGGVSLTVYSPSGNTYYGEFLGSIEGAGVFAVDSAPGTIIRD